MLKQSCRFTADVKSILDVAERDLISNAAVLLIEVASVYISFFIGYRGLINIYFFYVQMHIIFIFLLQQEVNKRLV